MCEWNMVAQSRVTKSKVEKSKANCVSVLVAQIYEHFTSYNPNWAAPIRQRTLTPTYANNGGLLFALWAQASYVHAVLKVDMLVTKELGLLATAE